MALQWSKEQHSTVLAEVAARKKAEAENDLQRGKEFGAQVLQEQVQQLETDANMLVHLLDSARDILKKHGLEDTWPQDFAKFQEKNTPGPKPGHYTYVRFHEQFPKMGVTSRALNLFLACCAFDETGTTPK